MIALAFVVVLAQAEVTTTTEASTTSTSTTLESASNHYCMGEALRAFAQAHGVAPTHEEFLTLIRECGK